MMSRLVLVLALAQSACCFLLPPSALVSPALRAASPALNNVASSHAIALAPKVSLRSAVRPGAGAVQMGLFDAFSSKIYVSKVQVALQCDTRGPSSILGRMSDIADEADTETDEGLEELVSDVALAVLRCEDDWISAYMDTVVTKSEEDGEDTFSEMSMKERAKIERETVNLVAGRDKSKDRGAESSVDSIGKSTVAVVTIIVALEQKEIPKVTDRKSLRKCLTALGGSDLLGASALLAAEVMWTPEEPWEKMEKDDLYIDYPQLMPL